MQIRIPEFREEAWKLPGDLMLLVPKSRSE